MYTKYTTQSQPDNRTFQFSVNTSGRDKDWDFQKLNRNFRDRAGNIRDVIDHIQKGHALCAGLLGGNWRAKRNVIGSNWLMLDIDNSSKDGYQHQLTIDEALEHPFIKNYACLIYTTASHKPEWHKFRLIFLLPEFVKNCEILEALTRRLMTVLPHDPACKDASRVFYGSTKATFPLIQPDTTLPKEWITEAIATVEREKIEFEQRLAEFEKRKNELKQLADIEGWNQDELIQQALDCIPPRLPGSGNYQECLTVLMALNDHYGAVEGEAIAERWSPSIKGTTWNISAKFRSFAASTGKRVTVGSLFHIAKQYGFRFPTKVFYNQPKGDRLCSREQWEVKHGWRELVAACSKEYGRICNLFKAPKTQGNGLHLRPDADEKNPTSQARGEVQYYQPGDRLATWQQLAKEGKKYILDISQAGTGKSHTTAQAQPGDFNVDKLFYISNDHRNPTIDGLRDWTDLPSRHNGLIQDGDRVRHPKTGETPNLPGNCHRSHLFRILASKGFSEVNTESSINPICGTCPLSHICKGVTAQPQPGASFRHDRAIALQNNRIRAHLDTVPQLKTDSPDGEISQKKNGAFIDEVSRQLNPINEISISLHEFDSSLMQLQTDLPEVWEVIKPIALKIRPSLSGDTPITQDTRHGWNHNQLLEAIGNIPDLTNVIEQLQSIQPDIADLVKDADSVSLQCLDKKCKPKKSKETQPETTSNDVETTQKEYNNLKLTLKYIRSKFRTEASQETRENLKNLPSNWLTPLLEILSGSVSGAIRIKNGELILNIKNERQPNIIKSFDFVVMMDATANVDELALMLGIKPEEITVISELQPDYNNLKIHQINDMGLMGKDRSPTASKRLEALRTELGDRHQSLGVIDHLAVKADDDGYWFVSNRGSNEYLKNDALLLIGSPRQNIGALQQKYITLTGDRNIDRESPGFAAFVQNQLQAEIIQGVGRLRANRRPNEQLTCYLVSNLDLSFLVEKYPGATAVKSEAFIITPKAGTPTQQTRHTIMQAFKDLKTRGEKITQQAIATAAKLSQPLISKVCRDFGGWGQLKKLLLVLIDSLYRGSNNFSPLDESEQWLINQYLPQLVELEPIECVKEVLEVFKTFGNKDFERLMTQTSLDIRQKILSAIFNLLPLEGISLIFPDVGKAQS
ncbi:PriCT-2 domain-containing protein [Calothrix sp. 336/3]|uniref:PriCT-2 domain-containing protein n=1 Tax=Calothrix sp. 336/3 TaxID=1337936 RepID=UPI00069C50A4|nr:PriCT-2 domain-containing protein [Calothrix sp. 336/3]